MSAEGLEADLIVCRCEEVGLATLCAAIEMGDSSVDAIKLRTRAGMGICQGRSCLSVVQSLVRTHHPEKIPELPKQRWPVRPVPLGGLSRRLDPPPELQIPLMELNLDDLEGDV